MLQRLFSHILLPILFILFSNQLLASGSPSSSGKWQPDSGEAYLQYDFSGGSIESISESSTHRKLIMDGTVSPGELLSTSCIGTQPARDTQTTTIQSTLVMAYIKSSPRVELKKMNEAEEQKTFEKTGKASVAASYRVPVNVKAITVACYVRPSWFNMNGGFSAMYSVQINYKVVEKNTDTLQAVPEQKAPVSIYKDKEPAADPKRQDSGVRLSSLSGWVLTERKPVRGTIPAPAEGGETRVEFGDDAIEMLLAKPFGNAAGGSRDPKNPQRLHARYSWSMPDVIKPSGQLVIVVKQKVLSSDTGKWSNAFGLGIVIENNWYLKGKTNDGTSVEPWVFGIGWGRPDWAQKDSVVTYERTWLWNEGKTGDKRTVSVSIQGIGTQKIEYVYEWKNGEKR